MAIDERIYGNKINNTILMSTIPGLNAHVPKSYFVPSTLFQEYLSAQPAVWEKIQTFLTDLRYEVVEGNLLLHFDVKVRNYLQKTVQTEFHRWLLQHRSELIDTIQQQFGERLLVVRSSGNEDSDEYSNAGGYESLVAVHPAETLDAMAKVAASFFAVKSYKQLMIEHEKLDARAAKGVAAFYRFQDETFALAVEEGLAQFYVQAGVRFYKTDRNLDLHSNEVELLEKKEESVMVRTSDSDLQSFRIYERWEWIPKRPDEAFVSILIQEMIGQRVDKQIMDQKARIYAPLLPVDVLKYMVKKIKVVEESYGRPMDTEWVFDGEYPVSIVGFSKERQGGADYPVVTCVLGVGNAVSGEEFASSTYMVVDDKVILVNTSEKTVDVRGTSDALKIVQARPLVDTTLTKPLSYVGVDEGLLLPLTVFEGNVLIEGYAASHGYLHMSPSLDEAWEQFTKLTQAEKQELACVVVKSGTGLDHAAIMFTRVGVPVLQVSREVYDRIVKANSLQPKFVSDLQKGMLLHHQEAAQLKKLVLCEGRITYPPLFRRSSVVLEEKVSIQANQTSRYSNIMQASDVLYGRNGVAGLLEQLETYRPELGEHAYQDLVQLLGEQVERLADLVKQEPYFVLPRTICRYISTHCYSEIETKFRVQLLRTLLFHLQQEAEIEVSSDGSTMVAGSALGWVLRGYVQGLREADNLGERLGLELAARLEEQKTAYAEQLRKEISELLWERILLDHDGVRHLEESHSLKRYSSLVCYIRSGYFTFCHDYKQRKLVNDRPWAFYETFGYRSQTSLDPDTVFLYLGTALRGGEVYKEVDDLLKESQFTDPTLLHKYRQYIYALGSGGSLEEACFLKALCQYGGADFLPNFLKQDDALRTLLTPLYQILMELKLSEIDHDMIEKLSSSGDLQTAREAKLQADRIHQGLRFLFNQTKRSNLPDFVRKSLHNVFANLLDDFIDLFDLIAKVYAKALAANKGDFYLAYMDTLRRWYEAMLEFTAEMKTEFYRRYERYVNRHMENLYAEENRGMFLGYGYDGIWFNRINNFPDKSINIHQLHNTIHQGSIFFKTKLYPFFVEGYPMQVFAATNSFCEQLNPIFKLRHNFLQMELGLTIHKSAALLSVTGCQFYFTEAPRGEEKGHDKFHIARLISMQQLLQGCNKWYPKFRFTSEIYEFVGDFGIKIFVYPQEGQLFDQAECFDAFRIVQTLMDSTYEFSKVDNARLSHLEHDMANEPMYQEIFPLLVEYRKQIDQHEFYLPLLSNRMTIVITALSLQHDFMMPICEVWNASYREMEQKLRHRVANDAFWKKELDALILVLRHPEEVFQDLLMRDGSFTAWERALARHLLARRDYAALLLQDSNLRRYPEMLTLLEKTQPYLVMEQAQHQQWLQERLHNHLRTKSPESYILRKCAIAYRLDQWVKEYVSETPWGTPVADMIENRMRLHPEVLQRLKRQEHEPQHANVVLPLLQRVKQARAFDCRYRFPDNELVLDE
ncbi:PEP/pyruvate-binding domain-containing protein [Tumebacillus avium]|uniref:PEP/pyruvate-binding domain-containing protein n=1 Tax=Tumebacillus avium TaxID=1903704 RepID=UPI0012FD7377|nr:PEP/pyruvate-binding domain-containing protein [Tumebacillus avium]